MTTRLGKAMKPLGLSDAQLAGEADLLRGQVFAYRTGRKVPGYDNATKLIEALKKHGVVLRHADLCSKIKTRSRTTA